MENTSLLQSFALDKDNRIRSVDEVARGLACECTCPSCGDKVIARQGEIREWHFAHASGADCEHGAESALHHAAKQLLLDSGGMCVPELRVYAEIELPDGRYGKAEALRPSAWLDFSSVEAERTIATIRPDIVAVVGSKTLLVEIAVTHFVDQDKRAVISALDVPAIEIDLAMINMERWSWEHLHEVVIESTQQKKWLHTLDEELLRTEAREKAMAAALALPLELPAPVNAAAPRTRFWIQHRMVDVIERPFGLAVWSPYDPALNEVIKGIVRPLGGRWQARFKNWLLPLESKAYLFDALEAFSERPATRV